MALSKGKFLEELLAPPGFSCIHGYLHSVHLDVWKDHVPRFWGNPHFAQRHLASFIDFVVDINIAHEDILMKTFTYTMNGKNVWEWCCSFNSKEMKSFPFLVKEFKKFWVYGYDDEYGYDDDACYKVDVCA